jgi:hypothetical protein
MSRVSESALIVHGEGGEWWIKSGSPAPDGPYAAEQDAIDAAIDLAKSLAKGGDEKEVLVQRGAAFARVWPDQDA